MNKNEIRDKAFAFAKTHNMLDKAEKEVGFETKNYKLMIEALAIPNRKFCFNCN